MGRESHFRPFSYALVCDTALIVRVSDWTAGYQSFVRLFLSPWRISCSYRLSLSNQRRHLYVC